MTAYAKGAAFERKVVHDLQDRGYYAWRSAGSHSAIDVTAIKHGILLIIQCKTDGKISKAEVAVLSELSTPPFIVPLLAENNSGRIVYRVPTRVKPWVVFFPGMRLDGEER